MRPKGERLPFIDRLRGLAAIVMLEVHVVNTLIEPSYRRWPRLAVLDFLNGLVAPTFLFCAGFAVALSLRRSFDQGPAGAAARRVATFLAACKRAALLLFIGYALHGYGVLWVGFRDPKTLAELMKADILQVIGLSLLTLNVLAFALRRAGPFTAGALCLGLTVVLSTPTVRALSGAGWPQWARPYFSAAAPAQFSLFPWASFALLGAVVGARPSASWTRKLGLTAIAAIAAAYLLYRLAPHLFPPHDPWRAGPGFTLLRFGLVCLLAAAFAWTQDLPLSRRLDPILLPFSRHSLLVYAVHLPLVHGGSFRALLGPTRGPLGCTLAFLAVAAAMYLLAWGMDRYEARRAARPAVPRLVRS